LPKLHEGGGGKRTTSNATTPRQMTSRKSVKALLLSGYSSKMRISEVDVCASARSLKKELRDGAALWCPSGQDDAVF
jgi:hypothetical protein